MRYTIAALLLTTPAFAGGYVAPITDAQPIQRQAQAAAHEGWGGFYAGLSYGTQRTKSQSATYEDREFRVLEDRAHPPTHWLPLPEAPQ